MCALHRLQAGQYGIEGLRDVHTKILVDLSDPLLDLDDFVPAVREGLTLASEVRGLGVQPAFLVRQRLLRHLPVRDMSSGFLDPVVKVTLRSLIDCEDPVNSRISR